MVNGRSSSSTAHFINAGDLYPNIGGWYGSNICVGQKLKVEWLRLIHWSILMPQVFSPYQWACKPKQRGRWPASWWWSRAKSSHVGLSTCIPCILQRHESAKWLPEDDDLIKHVDFPCAKQGSAFLAGQQTSIFRVKKAAKCLYSMSVGPQASKITTRIVQTMSKFVGSWFLGINPSKSFQGIVNGKRCKRDTPHWQDGRVKTWNPG